LLKTPDKVRYYRVLANYAKSLQKECKELTLVQGRERNDPESKFHYFERSRS